MEQWLMAEGLPPRPLLPFVSLNDELVVSAVLVTGNPLLLGLAHDVPFSFERQAAVAEVGEGFEEPERQQRLRCYLQRVSQQSE